MSPSVRGTIILTATLLVSACAPDGMAQFKAGQAALHQRTSLTMSWTTTTVRGVFTDVVEIDCDGPYYRHRTTTDLNAKAVAEGGSLSQGKPAAHQESEELVVDGAGYGRNTSDWEDPRSSNAMDWHRPTTVHDVARECQAMRDGEDSALVPFKRIIAAEKVDYTAKRRVGGAACNEYSVTYPDPAYADHMNTTDLGNGSSYSERPVVMKPMTATVCLDTTTALPLATTKGDIVATFSYAPIAKLGAPLR